MADSTGDVQAQLDAVNAAILVAIKGSSYSVAGRSKSNQSIAQLRDLRDELRARLGRLDGSSPMIVRGVPSGLRR